MTTSKTLLTSAGEQNRYVLDKLPSKMMNNNVLVRVDNNPTEDTVRKSGVILSGFAGSEWNDSEYMPRYGEVVMVPDKLVFMNPINIFSANMMEWGTEIEIEKGDTVYFGAMISANAESLVYNDTLYLLIPYSRCICRVRGEELYPINGYCLMEESIDKYRVDGLILDIGDKVNRRKGIVTHTGRKNDYYFGEDAVDADIEVGDEVVFGAKFFGYLESKTFNEMDEKIGYAQRRWITAKL